MPPANLPIHEILDAIRDHFAGAHELIVEAPPGAGKTTIVPLALRDAPWLAGRKIVMLQPRRLAARNAAQRMATLLGEDVGETVGYRMRLDTRVGRNTRIEVVTEGVLLRMLRDDPALDDVGLLIFDEFHERSLDADLGLALALYARETLREDPPLRLMLMSATLAQEELVQFLGARCIRSDGRSYPVDVQYGTASQPRERIAERMASAIDKALRAHADSSVLAFLPGQGEIQQTEKLLAAPDDTDVFPLIGSLSLPQQQRAIEVSPPGRRKVVLATNIAETSLTIEGVDVVVDSGLAREPVFSPDSAMSRLQTVKISQASSEQRAGRAGRLRPGTCYRLWSKAQQEQRQPQQAPEIQSADLAPLVLQLFAWGIYDPEELRWLTPPPRGAYQQALDLLVDLGAIENRDDGRQLTRHGAAMADLGTHPRLAHMLLAGQAVGAAETASHLAAVLSDRDPLGRESPDMRLRLEYLQGETRCPGNLRGWLHRTEQLAAQFRRQLPGDFTSVLPLPTQEQLPGYLLACAYPDRVARRRHAGGFQLANGKSCRFAEPNLLSKSKWLAVAEVGGMGGQRGDAIRSAAPFDPALFETLLRERVQESTQVDWDEGSGRFLAERRRLFGSLQLSRESIGQVSAEERTARLLELIRQARMSNLPWKGTAEDYRARAQWMSRLNPDWPSFDETALQDALEDWLAPFLSSVTRLGDLKKVDLTAALKASLSWQQQQELESALPERLEVPSGSKIRIDYQQNPPVLAVKLQEMFGCSETPAVANGRLPLLVHLLSPAGRPLQITQDLIGFWHSSYADVRKEMKGRYPKHPWPEDPLVAQPTRYTKKRAP